MISQKHYVDAYGIAVRIDKIIELSISDRYFELYRDGNLGDLGTGVQDGINDDIVKFVAGGSGTGFYIDTDVTLGIPNLIEIGFQIYI